uniref:ATP synthase subunit a n=1 Tax=Haemodracon trachyrhinus TaxID=1216929 RepID=A0A7R7G1U4_9SAUR|nr:ATPase subunit 6 [Haemodracon trachyrhinus]
MTMNLFDQFASPKILYIPLILMAMLLPAILLPKQDRLLPNRLTTLYLQAITTCTKHLMTPMNKTGHCWALPLLTILYFILMSNLLGLLPYTFTPTTQLSLNMALAFPLWLITILIGLRNQPTTTLAHLLPMSTPTLLIPILIVIETISLLIRPLALAVRLTANLTAGHLLLTLISTATMTLLPTMPLTSFTTALLLTLLTGLELAVAMIQAYVFVLLLSLYLQENT